MAGEIHVEEIEDLETPDFVIEFGTSTHVPKYESSIPRHITQDILNREKLPAEIPKLKSTIIEDFIFEKLHGNTSNEGIVKSFFESETPRKVDDLVAEIKACSETLDWENVFTTEDAKLAQMKVVEEASKLGLTSDQINSIIAMGIEVGENIGASSLSHETVYVSRLQCVRKALDYIAVFPEENLEKVIRVLMMTTTGHELGHKIELISEIPTNNIPIEWHDNNGDGVDNRAERFTEYWGRVGIGKDEGLDLIRSKEWGIHMAKITQLWDQISLYNRLHEEKIDLLAIFNGIDESLTIKNANTKILLWARRTLYAGNEVENYASPYSRETVHQAIKQTIKQI